VTFIPFYDECFSGMAATTVGGLDKYNRLYESCANQDEAEVRLMMDQVDFFLRSPNCTINVTGISTRSGHFTIDRTVPEPCEDDDEALQAMMPGQTCVDAAASGLGCQMVGVTEICDCSCAPTGVEPPPCSDNDAGLAELMGDPTFTCLAAAASGTGCAMAGVGDLCKCACPQQQPDGGGGHRRNRRRQLQDTSHLMIPPPSAALISSENCPMEEFFPRLQSATRVCCAGQGGCSGTVPLACTFDCGEYRFHPMFT
jgi:hypothetical protein